MARLPPTEPCLIHRHSIELATPSEFELSASVPLVDAQLLRRVTQLLRHVTHTPLGIVFEWEIISAERSVRFRSTAMNNPQACESCLTQIARARGLVVLDLDPDSPETDVRLTFDLRGDSPTCSVTVQKDTADAVAIDPDVGASLVRDLINVADVMSAARP